MKKAVIYARYSSDKQTEQSIEGQLHVCTDYAKRNDIKIVGTYVDRAMSGTNDHRTEFQRMIKDSAKREWSIILVYKLDRFSRNKYETAMHKKTLRDNGVKLVSAMENIPDTPEGIILESLLEGMAEYYSAELAQKVLRGMRENRNKGLFTGGIPPYGYKVVDKKVYIDKDQATIVKEIFSQYIRRVPIVDIISSLNERGIMRRKDKPFNKGVISSLLKNEKYIGISRIRERDEVFTGIFPPIITETTFDLAQKIADEKKHSSRKTNEEYLLSKKMKCGYCGKTMFGVNGTAKSGRTYKYYSCRGVVKKEGCTKKNIRKELIENLVVSTVLKAFSNKTAVEKLADDLIKTNKLKIENNPTLNLLITEKQQVDKEVQNLLYAISQGVITKSTTQMLTNLEEKQEQLADNINKEKIKDSILYDKKDIIDFVKRVIKSEPARLIKLLVDKIIIYDDKIEIICNYVSKTGPDGNPHQDLLFYDNIEQAHYVDKYTGKTDYVDMIVKLIF